jgi:hypothetical protein
MKATTPKAMYLISTAADNWQEKVSSGGRRAKHILLEQNLLALNIIHQFTRKGNISPPEFTVSSPV